MKSKEELRSLLHSIDHRGYPAYKDTRGVWRFDQYILSIDHVQGDPFASPSNISVWIAGKTAGFPREYHEEEHRRTALEDHLLRLFSRELSSSARQAGYSDERPEEDEKAGEGRSDRERGEESSYSGRPDRTRGEESAYSGGRGRRRDEAGESGGRNFGGGYRGGRRGSGKSGFLGTSRPGQEILPRTACRVDAKDGSVNVCLEAGFPAAGRTILAGELITMLFDILPKVVSRTLLYAAVDRERLKKTIELADDQRYIRTILPEKGLCAFVADGSCLPRESGVSELPMKNAVLFRSPDSLAVELDLPHRGRVRGLGVRKGVTLIVGGGYHGKSTLLEALETGVYNHIAGDGRELVITEDTAMKIRAEDGRCVKHKDISLFINHLPNGKDTVNFYTEDASGSTSQAANVVEALEAGTVTLLIDEDTSATNFMVRDEIMAGIISKDMEPITPFISRIRDMYEKSGISTILVAGSSGAYFYVADSVIQMDRYMPYDITAKVRDALKIGGDMVSGVYRAENFRTPDFSRGVRPDMRLKREQRLKLKVSGRDAFLIAHREVDLRGLSQIVDREQTRTLSYILKYMELHIFDGKKNMREAVSEMMSLLEKEGMEILFERSYSENGLARVRAQEIFGTVNRYRD